MKLKNTCNQVGMLCTMNSLTKYSTAEKTKMSSPTASKVIFNVPWTAYQGIISIIGNKFHAHRLVGGTHYLHPLLSRTVRKCI